MVSDKSRHTGRGPSRVRASKRSRRQKKPLPAGRRASDEVLEVRSYDVGALPLVNHILERMDLERILKEHLPAEDKRVRLPTPSVIMVLVRNVLMSREPMYGVGDWAARFAPDLLDLWPEELALIGDDRLGRAVLQLHDKYTPAMVLTLVRQVVGDFGLSLEELHNDSTTVMFYGAYRGEVAEERRGGRAAPIITWGHSKDRRPDLKQLLYTLTVSNDGAVPVYFTTASGNTADDGTHIPTWELLCELVGQTDFLYVADCKLASIENLRHIASRGGRFVTVLPRTRKEDKQFRARLRDPSNALRWSLLYEVTTDHGKVVDRLSQWDDDTPSSDGYRLLWYHSTRKAALDQATRGRYMQRAVADLEALRKKLSGPRPRLQHRQHSSVAQEVERILAKHEVTPYLTVSINVDEEATFKQSTSGRPGPQTQYTKKVRNRVNLTWKTNQESLSHAEREDGLFPLLSNDRTLTAEDILRAYKRQPLIEKRFSQFKSDFTVAPVFLKDVRRIDGLLTVYFFALMAQALLERELRQAMAAAGIESLPIYPEGRSCKRPTTARLVELFETVQRHEIHTGDGDPRILVTELTPAQRQIISLLGLSPETYGY